MRAESLLDLCQLPLAPDEACHLCGQVVMHYVECFYRSELTRQIGDDKLVDMFWAKHVLQAPITHIAQGHTFREFIPNQLLGGNRKQNLPTMRGRHQPLDVA